MTCTQHGAHDDEDIATDRKRAEANEPRTDGPVRRCGRGTCEWCEEEERSRDEGDDTTERDQAKLWRMRLDDEEPGGEDKQRHADPVDPQHAEAQQRQRQRDPADNAWKEGSWMMEFADKANDPQDEEEICHIGIRQHRKKRPWHREKRHRHRHRHRSPRNPALTVTWLVCSSTSEASMSQRATTIILHEFHLPERIPPILSFMLIRAL